MDQNLRNRKLRAAEKEKPLKYAQKVEKPPQRPPTPRIATPQEEDDDLEQAAILLQKLIRGRVAQNTMYYGKERRLNLINELRTRGPVRKEIGDNGGIPLTGRIDGAADELSSEGAINRKKSEQLAETERSIKQFGITGGVALNELSKQQVGIFIY